MKRFIALYIAVLSSINISFAQDRHYWYQQFGGRSSMLGGAVVGDVRDNSATFYNPGALSFIQNNSLSISANAYSLAYYKLTDALGQGQDLKGFPFLLYPQLVSGFIPFTKNEKWKFAYSMITRNSSNFLMFDRYEDTRDVNKAIVGDEKFISGFEIQSQKQEQWVGLSASHKITDNLSLGATMYVAYKMVSGSEALFYDAFPQTDNPVDTSGATVPFLVSSLDERRYYNIPMVALIWKFGLAYEISTWKFGLTSTLPSLNLSFMKFGDTQREIKGSNLYFDSAFLNDLIMIGRQENRLTRYNTPLSFAFGSSKSFEKGKVMISAEYFFPVDAYEMLEADQNADITSTPGGLSFASVPDMSVVESAKAVFNFGIGFEYRIMDKVDLLLGFRTDKNNYEDLPTEMVNKIDVYHSPWDLYHFTIGGNLFGKKSNVTAGIQYSLGMGKAQMYQNFTDTSSDVIAGVLSPNLGEMSYMYHGFSAVISYTYLFGSD